MPQIGAVGSSSGIQFIELRCGKIVLLLDGSAVIIARHVVPFVAYLPKC